MDQELKQYIIYLIKNSFVHSTIGEGYSIYSAGKDIAQSDFLLTVKYSHTDAADIWNEYELYLHGASVYKRTLPLNIPVFENLSLDLLEVLKKCSNKVIAQEKLAQKNMFIRTVADNNIVQAH